MRDQTHEVSTSDMVTASLYAGMKSASFNSGAVHFAGTGLAKNEQR